MLWRSWVLWVLWWQMVVRKHIGSGQMETSSYKKNHLDQAIPLDIVDDHNNQCHSLPSIEVTWRTDNGQQECLILLLSMSDVNVYLEMQHFVWDDAATPTYLNYHRVLFESKLRICCSNMKRRAQKTTLGGCGTLMSWNLNQNMPIVRTDNDRKMNQNLHTNNSLVRALTV